jgi:hypothetical protein
MIAARIFSLDWAKTQTRTKKVRFIQSVAPQNLLVSRPELKSNCIEAGTCPVRLNSLQDCPKDKQRRSRTYKRKATVEKRTMENTIS